MGKRGQVAGAPEAAVLGDDRRDTRRKEPGQRLSGVESNAGASSGKGGQPQQHERADDFALHLGAGSGGM